MPRDAVSRTAHVERTGRHKWVNVRLHITQSEKNISASFHIEMIMIAMTFFSLIMNQTEFRSIHNQKDIISTII